MKVRVFHRAVDGWKNICLSVTGNEKPLLIFIAVAVYFKAGE